MRRSAISSLPPHELLDDGFAPEPCELLVIGCGNILRGDDAVGPVLIRRLFERGVPDGVRLVDGGTAGMDVAFGMRGAARVVIVDASRTGAAPGTVYRVPAEELTDLPPLDGLHTHNFRWDHALSFSTWLLGPARPTDVTVFLVEGESFEPGAPLTPAVATATDRVADLILVGAGSVPVEITEAGYLHLSADVAKRYFPTDALVARLEGDALVLVPLASTRHGGLLLKQRTAAGDRSLLVSEVLGRSPLAGRFVGMWDVERGALIVSLDGSRDGDRGADRGGQGARAVGGLSPGDDARGGDPIAGGTPPAPDDGGAGRLGDPAQRGPQAAAAEGAR